MSVVFTIECLVCHRTRSGQKDFLICDECISKGYVFHDPTDGKKVSFWKMVWLFLTVKPYKKIKYE